MDPPGGAEHHQMCRTHQSFDAPPAEGFELVQVATTVRYQAIAQLIQPGRETILFYRS